MWFQNHIKSILKALLIACVVLVSPAFACNNNEFEYNGNCIESKFEITTTNIADDDYYAFYMSAAGVFYVDWGDGNVELIDRTNNTTGAYYSHTYDTNDDPNDSTGDDGSYVVKFGGQATGYNDDSGVVWGVSAIRFGGWGDSGQQTSENNNGLPVDPGDYQDKVAGISGSLGAVFSTIGATAPTSAMSGTTLRAIQPLFTGTFAGCSNMRGAIPANLFSGVRGQPADYMFQDTFSRCSSLEATNLQDSNNPGLTYAMPSTLFSGIDGEPRNGVFQSTFEACSNMRGAIPASLFFGIQGQTGGNSVATLFARTFAGSGVTGKIPDNLFSGISGALGSSTFDHTFAGCPFLGRVSPSYSAPAHYYIPARLFASVDVPETAYQSQQMAGIFGYNYGGGLSSYPELLKSCPDGTNLAITGFEDYFNGFVACVESGKVYCRKGYVYDSGTLRCEECTGSSCPDYGEVLYCPAGTGSNSNSMACVVPNSITYDLDGGTNNANNPATYTGKISLKEPQKANYKFLGWYRYSDFSGGEVTTLVQENDGNVELYAKWAPFNNKFQVTTTNISDGEYVAFMLNAQGTFWVDWGDGIVKRIVKEDASGQVYTHTYHNNSARSYVIKFDGDKPESYFDGNTHGATITFSGVSYGTYTSDEGIVFNSISFLPSRSKIAGISGSLGVLFPTLDDTDGLAANSLDLYAIQPRFGGAFSGCTNLTGDIPDALFDGIYGTRCSGMFESMFSGCTNLGKNAVDGTSTYYLSPIIYQVVTDSSFITGTGFKSFTAGDSCPSGMRQVKVEQYHDGNGVNHLSCIPYEDIVCPWGYELVGNTCTQCSDEASCPVQEQTCSSGYIVNAQLNACVPYYTISYNNVTGATLNSAVRYYHEYVYPNDNNLCKYSAQDNWGQCSYNTIDGSALYLNNPTKSGHVFLGWCDDDAELTQNCSTDKHLYYSSSDSNGYTRNYYAKWVPIYNINYMDDMGQLTSSLEYYYSDGFYSRASALDSWEYTPELTELSGDTEFLGWCVFDSEQQNPESAIENDCASPIKYIYYFNSIGNKWLYPKWGVPTANCSAGQYADSNLDCQYCTAGNYCPGGSSLTAEMNGLIACPWPTIYSHERAESEADCSVCPPKDFSQVTLPTGYYIEPKSEIWKDLDGRGANDKESDECVVSAIIYNTAVLQCAEIMPGTCDPTAMDAGILTCRYNSSTGKYSDCSSMATVCKNNQNDMSALMGVWQATPEQTLSLELSRKGLNQYVVDWANYFGENDLSEWTANTDPGLIVKNTTYCDASSQACTAGQIAEFKVYPNGTVTSDCVSCPEGSYCPNADTYTFADSVLAEQGVSYDTYIAGMIACPGGANSVAGSTAVGDCSQQACISDAGRKPSGNILTDTEINGATKVPEPITFMDSNKNTYSACANIYLTVVDNDAFTQYNASPSDAKLTEVGARMFICKYNESDGKYDLCTDAQTACSQNELTPVLLPQATTSVIVSGFAPVLPDSYLTKVSNVDLIQSDNSCESSCASGYTWFGNNCCPDGYACCLAGTKYDKTQRSCQSCSDSSCPATYTQTIINCPASNGTNSVPGVFEELNMNLESPYGSTIDKCVAVRIYYDDPTPLAGGYTISNLVAAGASIAFCRYNPASGHESYDGNCTQKYSMCSNDNLETIFSSETTVGAIKNILGLNSVNDISDSLFTQTSSGLASDTVINRCTVSCPAAGIFDALANPSVPGMVQFGYNLENSYGSTADECVSMRVYYNDATDLFTQYGNAYYPSQDISDWVDAGASVAFCKYNVSSPVCTPKYSVCSNDNMMAWVGTGDVVDIMQSALGISDPSTIETNFTEAPSTLASASAVNRCCPSGHICCAAGTYVNPDTATHGTENQCLTCPVGHYCPGDDWDTTTNYTTNKTACGVGTYNGLTGQDSASACSSCASGYYATAGSSSCTQAQAGYYVNNDASGQTQCTAGTYSLAGATSCTACPSGATSTAGASECDCPTMYSWNSSTYTCDGDTVNISWGDVANPGVAATCTYGSSFTAPSAPTPEEEYKFLGWRIVATSRLPAGYTELEYIQNNGTQYIGLNFGFDKTDEIEAEFSIQNTDVCNKYMVGTTSWNTNNNRFGMGEHCWESTYNFAYGSADNRDTSLSPRRSLDGQIHRWVYKDLVVSIPELSTSLDVSGITFGGTTTNLRLFYGGFIGSVTTGKMKYYKHIKNGTVVFEGIPVRRDSDNVVGLYDVANNMFYTGSGTGSFSGPSQ